MIEVVIPECNSRLKFLPPDKCVCTHPRIRAVDGIVHTWVCTTICKYANTVHDIPKAVPVGAEPKLADCGPGCELSKLLHRIGIREEPGCQCAARARVMDQEGAAWCRENIDQITGWMREEAEKRGLPFVEFAVRQLVKLAIRRAEKEAG